eukprot:gene11591-15525_t
MNDENTKNDKYSQIKEFVKGPYFAWIGLTVVILNSIVIASLDPFATATNEPNYNFVINLVIDSFFIAEFFVGIITFGDKYTSDFRGLVQIIVFLYAALHLTVVIIMGISYLVRQPVSLIASVNDVIFTIRPLELFKLMPYMASKEVVLPPHTALYLNLVIPMIALVGYSFVSHSLVGNKLSFRCVPTNFSSPSVYNNTLYLNYGVDYFYSSYNQNFCGYRDCQDGFSCHSLNSTFYGIAADFSTPWNSFISNMSFLTMRGWPFIFSAIEDTAGIFPALFILMLIFGTGTLFIFNLSIAVFIAVIKTARKNLDRYRFLKLYPGNLDNLYEIDLLLWAQRNYKYIDKYERHRAFLKLNNLSSRLKNFFSQDDDIDDIEKLDNPTKVNSKKPNQLAVLEKPKTSFCVPSGLRISRFRETLRYNRSGINKIIFCLVALNIVIFLTEYPNPLQPIKEYIKITNTVLASIFFVELIIRILVNGPFAYFNSFTNILDALCILYTLAVISNGGNGFVFSNIFRIIRFMKLTSVRESDDLKLIRLRRIANRDPSINSTRILVVIHNIVVPVLYFTAIQLAFMFFFTTLGMRLFPINKVTAVAESKALALKYQGLHILSWYWSDRFNTLLNFDNFLRGFQTAFSLTFLNSWYAVMIFNVQATGTYSFWFFFACIILNNLLVQPILVACINISMEKRAINYLRTTADENSALVERVVRYGKKSYLYKYFYIFKQNTSRNIAADVTDQILSNKKAKNEIREEKEPDSSIEFKFREFQRAVADRSLFIFERSGFIRTNVSKYVVETVIFQLLVFIAVGFSLLLTTNHYLFDLINAKTIRYAVEYVIIIFYLEMFLKWIVLGLFPAKWFDSVHYSKKISAYFTSILNIIDCALNILIMVDFIGNVNVVDISKRNYNQIHILRALKLIALIRYFIPSESMTILIDSIFESLSSLFTIFTFLIIVYTFFVILGLNLWNGQFGYCSYGSYPSGAGRYDSIAPNYPNGCNGGWAFNITVNSAIVSREKIAWRNPINHFNNAYNAGISVFRIIGMNNWADVLISATNTNGQFIQPKDNASAGAFLYFLILAMVYLVVINLIASAAYYHYIINTALKSKKVMMKVDDVIWSEMKRNLRYVVPIYQKEGKEFSAETGDMVKSPSRGSSIGIRSSIGMHSFDLSSKFGSSMDDAQKAKDSFVKLLRKSMKSVMNTTLYQAIVLSNCFVPMVLVLGFYEDTYFHLSFIYVDCLFSIFYVGDYIFRIIAYGFRRVINDFGREAVELSVVSFVFISLCFNIYDYTNARNGDTSFRQILMLICIILRNFRLTLMFPQLGQFVQILVVTLTGFIPLIAIIFIVLVIYAVIGNYILADLDGYKSLGNTFLQRHYNFQNYFDGFMTILGMATGNFWTEIIKPMINNKTYFQRIYIHVYFYSLYIILNILLKPTVILIIGKFLAQAGDLSSLPIEQLNQFKTAWFQVFGNKSEIDYTNENLIRFFRVLPMPLGIKGERAINHALIQRYVDSLFTPIVPIDISRRFSWRNNIESLKINKLKFHDVLIAVFKHRLEQNELDDELDFQLQRIVHRNRLGLLAIKVATLMKSHEQKKRQISSTSIACETLQLLQRINPVACKEAFVQVFKQVLRFIEININSFGFNDFEGFVIVNTRKAVKNELQAAMYQYLLCAGENATVDEKRRTESTRIPRSNADKAKLKLCENHLLQIKRLDELCDRLYIGNVKPVWKVESLTKVFAVDRKRSISCITIDNKNTVFVAFSKGIIEIYQNYNTKADNIYSKCDIRIKQLIKVGSEVRSIAITADSRRLFVAADKFITIYNLSNKKKTKGQYIKQAAQAEFHTSIINCLLIHEHFLVSGSNDSMVALWPLGSLKPIKTKYIGSPIFSLGIVNLMNGDIVDDITLSHALACGAANGTVTLLPVPLSKAAADSGEVWSSNAPYSISDVPVTSICYAWGYLYVGSADGVMRTCAIISLKPSEVYFRISPIDLIQLQSINFQPVHASSVTGLVFTGGYLFSSSFDFSILPWNPPEKENLKSGSDFKQSLASGLIFHSNPIVSIAANNNIIVTGDDSGQLVFIAPSETEPFIGSNHSDATGIIDGGKVCFSFLEHDFKECVSTHKGIVIEEEVYLNVTNISPHPIIIRAITKNKSVFRAEADNIVNQCIGTKTTYIKTSSLKTKRILEIQAGASAVFRISFSPDDFSKHYFELMEFIVDELLITKIALKGFGVKPSFRVEPANSLLDLDVVKIGGSKAGQLSLINTSQVDFIINVMDLPILDQYSGTNNKTVTLKTREIEIIPKTILLSRQTKANIEVRFKPTVDQTILDMPIYANLFYGDYKIATIRSRSQKQQADPIEKITTIEAKKVSIRPLKPTENLVTKDSMLVNQLLEGLGWGVQYSRDLVCFMHLPTGVFIEIPRQEKTARLAPLNYNPNTFHVEDSADPILIDYLCPYNTYYEVWLGNRRIHPKQNSNNNTYGTANRVTSIPIHVGDVITEEGSKDKQGVFSCGVHSIEILVFGPGSFDANNLRSLTNRETKHFSTEYLRNFGNLMSVSFLNIQKGFTLVATSEPFAIAKLDIVGIHHINTYERNGTVILSENYDYSRWEAHANKPVASCFSPLSVKLRSSRNSSNKFANKYIITDKIDQKPHFSVANHNGFFNSTEEYETIMLPLESHTWRYDAKSITKHVERNIDIIAESEEFNDVRELENKAPEANDISNALERTISIFQTTSQVLMTQKSASRRQSIGNTPEQHDASIKLDVHPPQHRPSLASFKESGMSEAIASRSQSLMSIGNYKAKGGREIVKPGPTNNRVYSVGTEAHSVRYLLKELPTIKSTTIPITMNSSNAILPISASSYRHSLAIRPFSDNIAKLSELQYYIRGGCDSDMSKLTSFFGKWHFVMDGGDLRLISTFENLRNDDNNEEKSDSIMSGSSQFHKPYLELLFTSKGFKMFNHSEHVYDVTSQVITRELKEDSNLKDKNRIISRINAAGITTQLETIPRLFSTVWKNVMEEELIKQVKIGFKKLLENYIKNMIVTTSRNHPDQSVFLSVFHPQPSDATKQKSRLAAKQASPYDTMSNLLGYILATGTTIYARCAEEESSQIMLINAIYEYLVDITNKYFANHMVTLNNNNNNINNNNLKNNKDIPSSTESKKLLLNHYKLGFYLLHNTLPNRQEPLTNTSIDIAINRHHVLQCDELGGITHESFLKYWNKGLIDKEALNMTGKNLFARLLQDTVSDVSNNRNMCWDKIFDVRNNSDNTNIMSRQASVMVVRDDDKKFHAKLLDLERQQKTHRTSRKIRSTQAPILGPKNPGLVQHILQEYSESAKKFYLSDYQITTIDEVFQNYERPFNGAINVNGSETNLFNPFSWNWPFPSNKPAYNNINTREEMKELEES